MSMIRLGLALSVWLLLVAGEATASWPLGRPEPQAPATYTKTTERPEAGQLRAHLQEILSRREYNQIAQSRLMDWLREKIEQFQRWWREHFSDPFVHLHDMAPVLYWTIFGLGVLIVALLLYHIYLTMRSAFGQGPRRRRQRGGAAGAEVLADPEALLAQADLAARQGDLPEALRWLYLALIRRLDRLEALRYDRAFTNHDYLRQVRGQTALREPLAALTATAERVWYGGQGLDEAAYARCRELALTVWEPVQAP